MDTLHNSQYFFSEEDQKQLIDLQPSLDQLGYFPREALEVITQNQHFHLFVPQERGGLGCSLTTGMRIIEAYSRIEGNLGWIVQIGAGGGVFAAYLEEAVARSFLGRPDQVIAGSDYAGGKAVSVPGGYKVSGAWKYASGSLHATAFTANCRIVKDPNDIRVKAVIVPAEQVTVIKDWNAMGMRATDSHSFRINDVFVPEKHAFTVAPDQLLIENRLLQLPFMLYARALFVPVLIGTTFRYLNLYRDYVVRRNFSLDSRSAVAADHLEKTWQASRNDLYQYAEKIWHSAEIKEVDKETEKQFSRQCIQITDRLLISIDQCHRHTGMEGIRMNSQINATYRNIKTAAAHFLLSPGSL
ncbi:hypothetical protein KUV50_04960 [Membranicola marinus]|uniref:Acyl-CoA dehydrogenase n=1 Tax=Membranihabitans marinus TaxID=1227546 RepID=A0A953HSC0_9BACT|nr:hypothetical protein [Membranihabitans marinus]MBY5957475.1 hypothetical protein [Membranihabitans marinus]